MSIPTHRAARDTAPATEAAQQTLLNFAVSHSPVIFYVADVKNNYTVRFVSANVEAITGHKPEDFTNDPMFGRRHLHSEDLEQFNRAIELVRERGQASREYRMESADGSYLWFRDEMKLAEGGEQFVGSMINITGEKQVRDQLREAEELNATIVGTVRNAIIAVDREGRVLDFNTSAERMFGYRREDALGRPLADLIVPEAHRQLRLASLVGTKGEIEAMRADGSVFPVEYHVTSARLKGQTVFVGEISDISERVAAEAERKRLTQLMQDAIESLPSGFSVSDPDGKVILCNTAFAQLYARTPASMLNTSRHDNVRTISRQLRCFDGQTVSGTEEDMERIEARLKDSGRKPVEMELKDGRWMLVSHGSTTDGGVVAIRTDITNQKLTEYALRDSEEYFRQIVENHPLPVLLFDIESGRVLYESPAVSALLRRWQSDEESYWALEYFAKSSERKRFVQALRKRGEVHGFDARVRLHDGTKGWVSVTARVINYKGRDTVIASLVDLTDRKAAEEALKASEVRYRTLVEQAPICIHELDLDGRIASMNPVGLQIAGAPKIGPVVGMEYLDLIHDDDKAHVARQVKAAMSGERVEMEFRGFTGKRCFFSTKIPLFNDAGEVERLIGVVIDITDRKLQETQLRQARETLEDAIESLPDGFALWGADDRLITCNARFREYNWRTADMLVPGVNWWDFMRETAARGQFIDVDEESIESWVLGLRNEVLEEGRTQEFCDAEGRWFRSSARRTRQGGMVGMRTEVTRYKQMEDALRDSEALVRQVLEGCPVPILMTRLDGEILYESPAGRALFGRDTASAPTYTLEAWANPADREACMALLQKEGALDEYEVLLRRSDGSVFPGAISARQIRFKGELVCVSSTRDLTESRAVEMEMQQQREALYQSEKLSAMGQLLASVAHELNNPLSVVVGQSLMLQETADEPKVVERARKIGKSADRCARIVKTFLAMARQQPAEMKSVNLNEVVETALEVTGYALRSHDIDVQLDLAPNSPAVWADADQLNQVLTNLIVNAQQALEGETGPRRIGVRTSYEPAARQLVLTLSDNGPGMPAEVRSRIFEPFFTTKDKGSGTGIGLAVSHRVVETHHGSISCDSEPGRGTTFTIRLPASPTESSSHQRVDPLQESGGVMHILIVDDEPDVAEVMAEMLAGDGHRVEVVNAGHTALSRIAEDDFDLILSDIRMPGLDGPGLYSSATEFRPELGDRFAFVTGDTLSPKAREFLAATDCPRVEKPVTLTELRGLVQRFTASGPASADTTA